MSARYSTVLRTFLCSVLALFTGLTTVKGQPDIWWTGGGDGTTWSQADNWFDGATARLPTDADVVGLGYADGDAVADVAQNINLAADATVGRLLIFGEGNRQVTVGTSNDSRLWTTQSDALTTLASATHDTTFDLTFGIIRNSAVIHNSPARLVFSGPEIERSDIGPAMRARWFFNGNEIVFDGVSVVPMDSRTGRGSGGTLVLDHGASLGTYTAWDTDGLIQVAGSASLGNLVGWDTFTRIERVGAADQTLSIQDINQGTSQDGSNTEFRLLPGPGEGHFTVRVQRWVQDSGWINTTSDSTVEIVRHTATLGRQVMEWADNPGVAGEGNLRLALDDAGHNFQMARELAYTGRTMLERGIFRLVSHTENGDVYYGQLPSWTIVEIGEDGTLDLNGIDQTVGGLTGYGGTEGEVQLNGGTLTIDAQQASSFESDNIVGGGGLVKAGPDIFTFTTDYTNPAGRTLRVEGGLLRVDSGLDSTLDVSAGQFELAGGRIETDILVANGMFWDVTLTEGMEALRLVEVATADITGGTLNLRLEGGYDPAETTQFTLLYASNEIIGASSGDMFGFSDGALLRIGSSSAGDPLWAQINWVENSESIWLTVVPEPSSTLLTLIAASLFLRHRRRK